MICNVQWERTHDHRWRRAGLSDVSRGQNAAWRNVIWPLASMRYPTLSLTQYGVEFQI